MKTSKPSLILLLVVGLCGAAQAQVATPATSPPPASPAATPPVPSSLLWVPPPPPPALLQPAPSPFSVRLAVDLPVIGVAGSIALVSELIKGELSGPPCSAVCDPALVNALDRTVIGNHSAAARTASDVLLGVNIGLPFALDLIDVLVSRPAARFRGFGKDVLVLAEVFIVNVGLVNVVKYAVHRPRPLAYDAAVDLAERSDPDASLSFFSGHSSTSFAMATAYSYLFMLRHPGSKLIAPVWVLSESMAAVTAYLRVQAGKHFYTDVLTGAVVGTALGLLIPYLHRQIIPANSLQKLAGLHLSAVPTISSDGAGILVSAY